MSAANSDKVFAKLFPVAKQRILAELKAGASSTRTTTTSIPLASDAALHWWQSILYGMLVPGRLNVGSLCVSFAHSQLSQSEHRNSYIDLLQVMVDSTYSERGYVWTGKILEKSMTCLVALYFTEMSMIPPKLRETEGM
jgi:proteasome activator subunit 4